MPKHRCYSKPLGPNEIRLLHYKGVGHSGQLFCELSNHERGDAPSYKALSYAWGSIDVVYEIICNDETVHVSRNAYLALTTFYGLGLWTVDHPLWIDAICINQNDDAEKTNQVRQMQYTYKHASEVLIWLGPQMPSDEIALNLLKRVADIIIHHGHQAVSELNEKTSTDFGLPSEIDSQWDDLFQFINKTWFSRTWIIQELTFATRARFVCGNTIVPSSTILEPQVILWESDYYRRQISSQRYPPRQSGNSFALWRIQQLLRSSGVLDLTSCLWQARTFAATDARDKVFAILSLCYSPTLKLIDYRLTLEEVLVETAKALLLSEKHPLDILSLSQETERLSDTPSWVPDWSSDIFRSIPLFSPDMGSKQVTGHILPYYSVHENKTLTIFSSVQLEIVQELSVNTIPLWDEWLDVGRTLRKTSSALKEAEKTQTWNLNDLCSLMDNAWELFCTLVDRFDLAMEQAFNLAMKAGKSTVDGGNEPSHVLFEKSVNDTETPIWKNNDERENHNPRRCRKLRDEMTDEEYTSGPHIISSREDLILLMQHRERMARRVITVASGLNYRNRGRKLALTAGGNVGWVCALAMAGDTIHAFEGSRFLYLLREKPRSCNTSHDCERSTEYELLGDVYISSYYKPGKMEVNDSILQRHKDKVEQISIG